MAARTAMPRRPPALSARILPGLVASLALLAAGCSSSGPHLAGPGVERGVASWYGPNFHGRQTANGERYDMHQFTAAHRTLPFGTIVRVRNLSNGLTTEVRINDRGPFKKNRIIDLSNAAAAAIEMIGPGTAEVELRVLRVEQVERHYVVQVGAFQELALAESLRARVASQFPQAVVKSDEVWHRVQVGDFGDRRAADDLRRRLQRSGFTALVVVTGPG
ncbi:MAG: septal ring lytic transglycosylase RlpA family protein [Thermoanaerobaculia bacterium]